VVLVVVGEDDRVWHQVVPGVVEDRVWHQAVPGVVED
jgi:hypothetical protein